MNTSVVMTRHTFRDQMDPTMFKERKNCYRKNIGVSKKWRGPRTALSALIKVKEKGQINQHFYMPRNSFVRFRAGQKVNLRQYIKSDFSLF